MTEESMNLTAFQNLATRIGALTTVMIVLAWISIVLLSGSMIPRSAILGAALAIAVALCANRAIRGRDATVLLIVVPLGAVIPPELGAAPDALKFVGFLSFGYVAAAILLMVSMKLPRRVG